MTGLGVEAGGGPGDDGLRARVMRHRLARSVRGEGLRARAMRGAGWTTLGFGANQIVRLASTLILTRLLFPEVFGLMALANVFLTGLQMFSDIGIRPSIIQNKRGENPEFLNTAWTMQVIRGFVLWGAACALAYPVAIVYNEPTLFAMLCVLGSTATIRGFQTTGYATLNRRLMLGKLTGVELITSVTGLVVTVIWATVHPTVWALVGGAIVSAVFSVILGHSVLNSHRHRLRWERAAARELVRFGKWIFLSTSLTFLAQSGDKLLLPHILSIRDLSFYAIALTLLMIPVNIFKQIASRVMFPVFSSILNDSIRSKEQISRATRQYTLAMSPLFLMPIALIFWSNYLVDFIYDPRYGEVGYALGVLAAGGFLGMMRATQAGLLLAAGMSKQITIVLCVRIAVGLPTSIFFAAGTWGLEGFCAGLAAGEAAALFTQRHFTTRVSLSSSSQIDLCLLVVLLIAITLRAVSIY